MVQARNNNRLVDFERQVINLRADHAGTTGEPTKAPFWLTPIFHDPFCMVGYDDGFREVTRWSTIGDYPDLTSLRYLKKEYNSATKMLRK